MGIDVAKMELRTRMRAAFDNSARAEASAIVCEKLRALKEWQGAKVVMAFAPLGDEPNIEPLLCATRATALPRWIDDAYEPAQITDLTVNLCPGKFGVREPSPECAALDWTIIDLMLVPALAFDNKGNRLGRGGGFYDRLIDCARNAGPVTVVGVCFEWQLTEKIPVAAHDRHVDIVVSSVNG